MSDHDGPCNRCGCRDGEYRIRCGTRWVAVCEVCVVPGDEVWIDLPNGQIVADVAPEVVT